MAPPSLWSGNLRLSLVLIPVRLVPAVSTEEAISFRQIHEPSGEPIKYVKGIREGDTFTDVPDEEVVKGYEYAKGQYVLLHPKEIDELKLEAKHTIDMARFVDEAEIDTRYWEKPQPLRRGLMLAEIRPAEPYFENLKGEANQQAVTLAAELMERESGRFEPEKMPDEFAAAVRELIQAKIEQRAPEIIVAEEGKSQPKVINIMAALKESMEAKGRGKVRDVVRKRTGKAAPKERSITSSPSARPRARPAH
jgi:DNA end-binding protein Ku